MWIADRPMARNTSPARKSLLRTSAGFTAPSLPLGEFHTRKQRFASLPDPRPQEQCVWHCETQRTPGLCDAADADAGADRRRDHLGGRARAGGRARRGDARRDAAGRASGWLPALRRSGTAAVTALLKRLLAARPRLTRLPLGRCACHEPTVKWCTRHGKPLRNAA